MFPTPKNKRMGIKTGTFPTPRFLETGNLPDT